MVSSAHPQVAWLRLADAQLHIRDFANQPLGGAASGTQSKKATKANTSLAADITLPDHSLAWGTGGNGGYDYGLDGGIDSQLYANDGDLEDGFDADFELGILDEDGALVDPDAPAGKKRARGDGEERSEGDMSVEQGRDAAVALSDRSRSRHGSEFDFDMNMDGLGKGLDDENYYGGGDAFDINDGAAGGKFDLGDVDFGALEADGGARDRERSESDWCAAIGSGVALTIVILPTAPQALSLNGEIDESLGLTPKTAADLAAKKKQKAQQDDAQPKAKKARTTAAKKQLIDNVTELEWQGGRNKTVRYQEVSIRSVSTRQTLRLTLDASAALLPPRFAPTSPPARIGRGSDGLSPSTFHLRRRSFQQQKAESGRGSRAVCAFRSRAGSDRPVCSA